MSTLDFTIKTGIEEFNFSKKPVIINTLNPHSYCVSQKDELFHEALSESDFLIPDGIGIIWAIKLLSGHKTKRITGYSLHSSLLKHNNKKDGRVFYLGSNPETLKKIKDRLKNEYPNIVCGFYSPPYKSNFTTEENKKMIAAVNAFKPNILFIGMTAPKQEKWVHKNKKFLDTKIIASIGAVFDFYAGTIKRPGKIWQKMGLEWLPRFYHEPKRLWRRNLISTPYFIYIVIVKKIGMH